MVIREMEKDGRRYLALRDVGRAIGYSRMVSLQASVPVGTGKTFTDRKHGMGQRMRWTDGARLRELAIHLPDRCVPEALKWAEYADKGLGGMSTPEGPEKPAEGAQRPPEPYPSEAALAVFGAAAYCSKSCITVREFHRLLRQAGYPKGERDLYVDLVRLGVLLHQPSNNRKIHYLPGREASEKGWIRLTGVCIVAPNGSTSMSYTVKVTGKGQVVLMDKLMQEVAQDE